jgi:hypothetical protein
VSYPQQGGYPQQQPYSGGGGYPAASGGGTNPATAIIAALLALVVTAAEIIYEVKFFDAFSGVSLSLFTVKMWITIGVPALAGLILLLGAMFTFGRKTAGAVLIIFGAIAGIIGFFLAPLLSPAGASGISVYLSGVFEFGEITTIALAAVLIGSPLALIFAVLPSTLRHLRGDGGDEAYAGDQYPSSGGFPQQQQQQPQGGYQAPNSEPFPQQGYPGYQPQQGQGGYPPQQQQGGGYPPQQQGW